MASQLANTPSRYCFGVSGSVFDLLANLLPQTSGGGRSLKVLRQAGAEAARSSAEGASDRAP